MASILHFCALLLILQAIITAGQIDLTLEEGAIGIDVTEASVFKIRRSTIFQDDYSFMIRLPYVESEFGEADDIANDGGIWQVNEAYLQQSKNDRLQQLHDRVNDTFGITWSNVTYEDMQKPLYSGLAASLYLASLPDPIPQKVEQQASFWLENYNQRDYTEEVFIIKVKEMEDNQRNCSGKVDVELVLDGSGSIGSADFEIAREFILSLVQTFTLNNTRVGLLTFATDVQQIFPLENSLTLQEMEVAIQNMPYLNGNTNTNDGILRGVQDIQAASARPGIPSVLAVLTDGGSGTGVGNIELARQANITTFGIGIGSGINAAELLDIALNDPNHVFELTDFEALAEFFQRLNQETCTLPQKPNFNVTFADELEGGERRYYEYPLPSQGVTVEVSSLLGEAEGYFSRTIENPSSAVNDGSLGNSTFISSSSVSTKAYLMIEGVQGYNLYTITVYEGSV